MKIRRVTANNRRRLFEIQAGRSDYTFPYALAEPTPEPGNKIVSLEVDKELGKEAFTYVLESGDEGTVHIDHVLEYNKDPGYLADLVLYQLTLEARKRFDSSSIGARELARRLGTSASQLYRLLDSTNYKKSLRQILSLLYLLNCEVDVVVKEKKTA
jgi:hypothetical protein